MSLDTVVNQRKNPFFSLWIKFQDGKITNRELQWQIRKWQLKRLHHFVRQESPPLPNSLVNMENWEIACQRITSENISNRHWLSELLSCVTTGKWGIEEDPGQAEEISKLLEAFGGQSRVNKETKTEEKGKLYGRTKELFSSGLEGEELEKRKNELLGG